MATITRVRPVLLTAPYGDPTTSMENFLHLPSGLRTSGFVEITLEDGTVGIGEGYLAVFAPQVFRAIVDYLTPVLVGRESRELDDRVRDVVTATGYWSLQGAARHVISAVEIALQDANARLDGVPLWRHLGGTEVRPLSAYASGGDSISPEAMSGEVARVHGLGITTFKIRGRAHQVDKVAWTQREATRQGIAIAVDMTQNLVTPSQSPDDVRRFLREVEDASGSVPVFVEEVLGPDRIGDLAELRAHAATRIAGGEIVTTPVELSERIRAGAYDIAQPDATVIGGLGPVLEVFDVAKDAGTDVYVHCWGAGIGLLANYHAALAASGPMVEWPLPEYALRGELLTGAASLVDGAIVLTDAPGLGVQLTPELEAAFPFRDEAIYECLVDPARVPAPIPWE